MKRVLSLSVLSLVALSGCDGCEEPTLASTYEFCLRPGDVDFGQQHVRTAETRTIAVTNCGNVPVDRIEVELVPLDADGKPAPGAESPYKIVHTEVPSPFVVGDHFFVPVRFRPTETGVFEAELHFTLPGEGLSGPAARQHVSGEGVLPPECSVSLEPASVTFSSLEVGERDEATISVTNGGTGVCSLGGARITEGSDAFVLVSAGDDTVAPGASTTLTVAYEPKAAGSHTGELALVIGGASEVTASLAGEAADTLLCRLAGDPDPIVFPRATVAFSETSAEGSLISVGDLPCTIASVEVTAGASDFSLASGPAVDTVLGPTETAPLSFTFHPTAVGARSGVVRFTTVEGSSFDLALSGLADPQPRCALQFFPSPLFFDAIGVGLTSQGTITATNISLVDCPIDGVAVTEGATDFALLNPPAPGTLGPGQTLQIEVAFTPQHNAPALGVVSINHGDEVSEADLIGFGSYADLRLTPRQQHFGIITQGCVSETYEIELTNVGVVAGRVDEVAYTALSDPNFEILSGIAPGTMLLPGESAVIEVRMSAAPVVDMHAGQLEVRSTGTVQPRLRAAVFGTSESVEDAHRTDVFIQRERPAVDILFVIDDSGSMGQEQANLAANFSSFINFFTTQADVDYHLGVTTTDTSSGGAKGALVGPFIAKSGPNAVPDPEAVFTTQANVGTNGSATEKGLEASALAVTPPNTNSGAANENFLRDDALLSIIYVSDEEDSSNGAVNDWLDTLLAAKGYRVEALIANAIAGDVPGGCDGAGGNADAGSRYLDIVLATGGVFGSICTTDWATVMEQIGLGTFFALTRFGLTREPDPDTLVVIVDGQVIPNDPLNGWSWDPVDNSIEFNGDAIPEAGSEIEVSYTAECILP